MGFMLDVPIMNYADIAFVPRMYVNIDKPASSKYTERLFMTTLGVSEEALINGEPKVIVSYNSKMIIVSICLLPTTPVNKLQAAYVEAYGVADYIAYHHFVANESMEEIFLDCDTCKGQDDTITVYAYTKTTHSMIQHYTAAWIRDMVAHRTSTHADLVLYGLPPAKFSVIDGFRD